MIHSRIFVRLFACLLIAGLLVTLPGASAEDAPASNRLDKLAKSLEGTIPLTKAIQNALVHKRCATGTAVAAKLDIEDGKPVWEVYILVAGDAPHVVEVEVDAKTGAILEVEVEDEDEDDDHEEDHDDEDGHDDDDDDHHDDDDDEGQE